MNELDLQTIIAHKLWTADPKRHAIYLLVKKPYMCEKIW